MKKILYCCVILFASSCGKDTQNQDISSEEIVLKSKNWVVTSIIFNGNKFEKPSLANNQDYIFLFTNDSVFSLTMEVNDLVGGYYSVSNNISFDNIGSTKVCCDSSFDENLKSILVGASKYYYSSGRLTLQYGENKIYLKGY